MAVKFSQFASVSPTATTFLVGYDGSTNVQISYSSFVGGSGTTNYLSKWTSSTALGNSLVFDNGTSVGIGTTSITSGYRLEVAGSTIIGRSNATAILQIRPNNGYGGWIQITEDVQGDRWSFGVANNSGTLRFGTGSVASNTARVEFFSNGNVGIGVSGTDAGFRLDVNGTARINGVLQFGSQPTIESFGGNQQLKITSVLGLTISSDRWNSNTSTSSYIQNGYSVKSFVVTPAQNANLNSFDFSASSAFAPTIAVNYNQKLINGAMTINSTAVANFFGVDSRTTDNSASIANNVYAIYADATLGTNTSAIRWAGYFVGRGYFSDVVGIGTTSPSNKLHVVVGNVDGLRVESSNSGYLEVGKTSAGRYRLTNSYSLTDVFEILYGSSGSAPTTSRFIIHTNGNTGISTTIDAGYRLDVNGTARVSGTELRLDNGTTGVINLYSATPEIRFAAGDPTGYRFYRSGTSMFWNAPNINLQIGGNDGYRLSAANGHIWLNPNSGGTGLARLDTGGSLSIGNGSTAANASSILDLTSTTKGFLPPRMTNAQMTAIATPASGLMVYDTTNNKLNYYNGTQWVGL